MGLDKTGRKNPLPPPLLGSLSNLHQMNTLPDSHHFQSPDAEPGITVIIPCFNEELNMVQCLESVKWAEQIMVVDSFSTDRTLEIARQYTADIVQRKYISNADQMNWAIPRAACAWVLVVEADERVTRDLKNEILGLNLASCPEDGFWIKRENYLFGKKMRYSGWGKDQGLRLFKRDKGRKQNKRVHAEYEVPRAGTLKSPMLHYPMPSMEVWVEKINRYTTWKAMDKQEKESIHPLLHLFLRPGARFFKDSLLRLGFLDGWRGLLVAAMSAFAELIMSAKLLKLKMDRKSGTQQ
ncbi:MAG: glycosyltransferase family 2 protein [Desulfonatronovibrionaceae bacterium]